MSPSVPSVLLPDRKVYVVTWMDLLQDAGETNRRIDGLRGNTVVGFDVEHTAGWADPHRVDVIQLSGDDYILVLHIENHKGELYPRPSNRADCSEHV